MRQAGVMAVIGAWILYIGAATAQNAPLPDLNGRALQELYGGVIANQTISPTGQAFYQGFVTLWRDKPMNERYAISIHERATARSGSQIWVEYAQRRVFQAFLPPARAGIRSIIEQAVEQAYQNVVDADVQRLLFRDPDIGTDEI